MQERLDIDDHELLRIGRLYLYSRFIPTGNMGTGPGIRCLAVLYVLHRFGRPLFRLLIRYEDRLTAVYRRLGRLRGGNSQRQG